MRKIIDLKELLDHGYVQEVNRLFFHPLGLALMVTEHDDGRPPELSVCDSRDDLEGFRFVDGAMSHEKFARVCQARGDRSVARYNALGYIVQPPPLLEVP